MPTLLEIGEDLTALEELLDGLAGGEVPDATVEGALERWFAEVHGDLDQKIDNYVALIRSWQLRAAVRREEMERLTKKVQADENNARRLKDRLLLFLQTHGTKKLETARYTVALCANGGRPPLRLPDRPELLPAEYQRITVTADLDALHAALKAGASVPGVEVLPRGSHVRIT